MNGGGHTEIYGSGTTPKTSDTERMLLVKILDATNSGGGGGGTAGVFEGAGDPNGVQSAAIGSVYSQIVGGVLIATWTNVDGGTTWQ